jgi:hypothetical protein
VSTRTNPVHGWTERAARVYSAVLNERFEQLRRGEKFEPDGRSREELVRCVAELFARIEDIDSRASDQQPQSQKSSGNSTPMLKCPPTQATAG